MMFIHLQRLMETDNGLVKIFVCHIFVTTGPSQYPAVILKIVAWFAKPPCNNTDIHVGRR